MVLSTMSKMSNESLHEYLAQCAIRMDTDTLRSALKEGVFSVALDASSSVESLSKKPDQNGASSNVRVVKSIASVLRVFENVKNEDVDTDENGNDLRESVSVAKLYASPAFSDFFSDLVKGFLRDKLVFDADFKGPGLPRGFGEFTKNLDEKSFEKTFKDTSVGLMALACALDMPKELKDLVTGVPGAMKALGSADYAGSINGENLGAMARKNDEEGLCQFMAPFFAIHYSSPACLDVLLEAGWKAYKPLGAWTRDEPGIDQEDSDDPLKKWNKASGTSGVSIVDVIVKNEASFSPEMMSKILNAMPNEYGEWRGVDRIPLVGNMRDRMEVDADVSYGYLPAMLTTTLMDVDLGLSMEYAADSGSIEVFDRYADQMPWDDVFRNDNDSVLMRLLSSSHFDENKEHFKELTEKIFDLADSHNETRIFGLHVDEDGKVQPLEKLVELDMPSTLIRFMKNGLRQDSVIEGSDKTLRSILRSQDNEDLEHIVQTFENRQRAMLALAEINAACNSHSP